MWRGYLYIKIEFLNGFQFLNSNNLLIKFNNWYAGYFSLSVSTNILASTMDVTSKTH